MSVLLGSEVSELAWERGEAPHVLWGSGRQGLLRWALRHKQTYLLAVDLHKAVMTSTCTETDRYASRILRSQPLWLQRQNLLLSGARC